MTSCMYRTATGTLTKDAKSVALLKCLGKTPSQLIERWRARGGIVAGIVVVDCGGDVVMWWWAPARWFGILPKTGLDSESWRETGVAGFPYRNR
jgi:hypothetical protein